jgi:hypothetical protein
LHNFAPGHLFTCIDWWVHVSYTHVSFTSQLMAFTSFVLLLLMWSFVLFVIVCKSTVMEAALSLQYTLTPCLLLCSISIDWSGWLQCEGYDWEVQEGTHRWLFLWAPALRAQCPGNNTNSCQLYIPYCSYSKIYIVVILWFTTVFHARTEANHIGMDWELHKILLKVTLTLVY